MVSGGINMKKLEDKIKEVVEIHQRNEQIIAMRASGKKYQEIADHFGITKAWAHAIVNAEKKAEGK
jgi:transcriptional regulator